ncbi:MAG: surface-adhesin E family protein [Acidobacteriota bacterium]
MRLIGGGLLFFILVPFVQAQEKTKWQRIATYEDSIVSLDISNVTFSTSFSGRVRFRLELAKSEPVSKGQTLKYRSLIQTIDFICEERKYRVFETLMFDSKGKPLDVEKPAPETQWQSVRAGGIMEQWLVAACRLIAEKKGNS